jgi:hypothetical protein
MVPYKPLSASDTGGGKRWADASPNATRAHVVASRGYVRDSGGTDDLSE